HTLHRHLYTHTPPPSLYTLSLHDALPISASRRYHPGCDVSPPLIEARQVTRILPGEVPVTLVADINLAIGAREFIAITGPSGSRSEEHTSELQSHLNLVCRLLLGKKKTKH